MEDQEMYLHEMGLSEYESSAYLALLSKGKATAKVVAKAGDLPQSRVYDVLEKLEKKGFVISQPGRPKKYGAVQPERAIDQYGEYKEERFESEYEELMSIGEKFVSSVDTSRYGDNSVDDPDVVWSYYKEYQLFDVFGRLCKEAAEEIRMLTRADSIERKVGRLDESLSALSEQGVRLRILTPRNQQIGDAVGDRLDEYAEVRQGRSIESQMYLFDEKAVLIAFKENDQYVGLSVHNRALNLTLNRMFDVLWELSE